jgi:LytS/YehU family sensor histidine kinase
MPNVEPILAATMPFGRVYGAFLGFSFGFLSILFYDVLTGTLGIQTLFTAGAFGLLGWWSASYFKKHEANAWNFMRFAIVGTLFFDALTGLTVGPIFFHQSFMTSLVGQIPFTVFHLIGNTVFAFILSPVVYNFLIRKKKKETKSVISILNPKTI